MAINPSAHKETEKHPNQSKSIQNNPNHPAWIWIWLSLWLSLSLSSAGVSPVPRCVGPQSCARFACNHLGEARFSSEDANFKSPLCPTMMVHLQKPLNPSRWPRRHVFQIVVRGPLRSHATCVALRQDGVTPKAEFGAAAAANHLVTLLHLNTVPGFRGFPRWLGSSSEQLLLMIF